MYAIVDIAGKQFKVEKNQYIYAPKMDGEAGSTVTFDQVLLIDNESQISVGTPVLKGASVTGKILAEEVKGDKEIVFKKKRRKGYAVKNGHRQKYTKVMIEAIAG